MNEKELNKKYLQIPLHFLQGCFCGIVALLMLFLYFNSPGTYGSAIIAATIMLGICLWRFDKLDDYKKVGFK